MAPLQAAAGGTKPLDAWLDRYRRFWSDSFDKMETYLAELQAKEERNAD